MRGCVASALGLDSDHAAARWKDDSASAGTADLERNKNASSTKQITWMVFYSHPNKKQAWTRRSTLQPTGRSALQFHARRVGKANGGLKRIRRSFTGDTGDHGLPPIVQRTHNGWGTQFLWGMKGCHRTLIAGSRFSGTPGSCGRVLPARRRRCGRRPPWLTGGRRSRRAWQGEAWRTSS